MLQIFERGKATVLFRDIERQFTEDLLTGAVFGTLAYVDSNTALEMLKAILGKEWKIPLLSITQLTVELWPRSSIAGKGSIEPDVLIDLFAGEVHSLRLIVEAKWGAGLGPSQGIAQWDRFVGEANDTWHVFPVRDVGRTKEQLERQTQEVNNNNRFANWGQRQYCVSWFNIARSLNLFCQGIDESSKRAHLRRWAEGILFILKSLGEKPFEGFGRHRLCPMLDGHVSGSRIFWMGPRVREFNWPDPVETNDLRPVFFMSKREV